jgi:hypothetical protein
MATSPVKTTEHWLHDIADATGLHQGNGVLQRRLRAYVESFRGLIPDDDVDALERDFIEHGLELLRDGRQGELVKHVGTLDIPADQIVAELEQEEEQAARAVLAPRQSRQ